MKRFAVPQVTEKLLRSMAKGRELQLVEMIEGHTTLTLTNDEDEKRMVHIPERDFYLEPNAFWYKHVEPLFKSLAELAEEREVRKQAAIDRRIERQSRLIFDPRMVR